MHKIAALTSHPIQYQDPLFKKIGNNDNLDLMVYFCWDREGKSGGLDSEFGKKVKWDIPLTAGYNNIFLNNYSLKPSSSFLGQINPGITREIWRSKPDAVLVFGWNSLTNWLAFFTCFIKQTPVFLRGENPLNQELLKSIWKVKIKKVVLGWLFRHISSFLYIGGENKKFYKFYGVPNVKLFFAPYAVDNDRFMRQVTSNQKSVTRKKTGIKEEDVVILFAGKLIDKKRPLDLLRAFELLITNYQLPVTPHLLFVGDGELRPELERYVLDKEIPNVKFLGFKNQTEIPAIYALSDILVLPSGAGETWGLAVNEAMCFGVVPVVSDIIGCGPDLVRHNENGFIFKLGDMDELAKYLSELIKNKEKLLQFSKRSRELISGYSYEQDIKGLLAALKKV